MDNRNIAKGARVSAATVAVVVNRVPGQFAEGEAGMECYREIRLEADPAFLIEGDLTMEGGMAAFALERGWGGGRSRPPLTKRVSFVVDIKRRRQRLDPR